MLIIPLKTINLEMVFISTPITRGVLFCWCSGPFGGSLTVLPVSLSVWMEAVMMHPRVELKVLLKVYVLCGITVLWNVLHERMTL